MEILPRRIWIVLLLLPFLWLAPMLANPGQIHAAPGAQFSDLAITHIPNAELLERTLQEQGEVPLWNPYILGGTPFVGDPLSGMYYPLLWLAVLLPPALTFNIIFLLHLAFAGLGAFFLARDEGIPPPGALLAGIAFGGLPKLVAHISAGHLTLVLAVAWTPWLMLSAAKAARGGGIRWWAVTGAMAGIIFLADPRWALPASLAAIVYAIVRRLRATPDSAWPRKLLHGAKWLVVISVFALAVSAVLLVPMLEFLQLSSRINMQAGDALTLSLPPLQLLGMLFSGIGGSVEWVIYPGAVILALAVLTLFPSPPIPLSRLMPGEGERGGEGKGSLSPRVSHQWSPDATLTRGEEGKVSLFWPILFLIALFLSLGSNIPGFSSLVDGIPGVNLLRVPPRWMFLAGLALAMMAGRGLSGLIATTHPRRIAARVAFGLMAAGAMGAIAGLRMLLLPPPFVTGAFILCATGLLLFLALQCRMRPSWTIATLMALACVDLGIADVRLLDPNPFESSPADAARVAEIFATENDNYRVYSPSYSIPQEVSFRYGLRMLDGVDPLMLQSTVAVVSDAARIPMLTYSVTLPAFASGNPAVDNRGIVPDARLLGLLNVRLIVSGYEIPAAMLSFRGLTGGLYVYENPLAAPRAWIAAGPDSWDLPLADRRALVDSDSPNNLQILATGPGLVVVSEAAYPFWRLSVDGDPALLQTVGGWWRAVSIGAGAHTIRMWIEPVTSWIGLAVTLAACIALVGVWRWAK